MSFWSLEYSPNCFYLQSTVNAMGLVLVVQDHWTSLPVDRNHVLLVSLMRGGIKKPHPPQQAEKEAYMPQEQAYQD